MIVTLELKDYNKVANKNKTLESNEIFLHIDKKGNYDHNTISLMVASIKLKKNYQSFREQ